MRSFSSSAFSFVNIEGCKISRKRKAPNCVSCKASNGTFMLKHTSFKASEICLYMSFYKILLYFVHVNKINPTKLEVTFGLRIRISNSKLVYFMLAVV